MEKTLTFLICLLFPFVLSVQDPFYFIQFTNPQFGQFKTNVTSTLGMQIEKKQIGYPDYKRCTLNMWNLITIR